METMDRDKLLRLLDLRLDAIVAGNEPLLRYFEGRIDGHCLQNGISHEELHELAWRNGYTIAWETAMQQAGDDA